MKRSIKKNAGVTLLEIMLVLAIAAMVIVMSIRFYRSASNSQAANGVLSTITAISSAADNLAAGNNSYSVVTFAALTGVMGTSTLSNATITGQGATSYSVSITTNQQACSQVLRQVTANTKITGASCSAGVLSYSYVSTN